MSSELATIPPSTAELDSYMRQAELLSQSALVPAKFRGKPADVLVAALQGREVGWGVVAAMTYIDVIQGVPTINAKGKTSLILKAGHTIEEVEANSQRAVVKGTRGDTGASMTVSYTIDEAKQAGLLGKDNWKKHTADMLWARAVSRLCRRLFEDVLGGASYDPTEIDVDRDPEPQATVTELRSTGTAVDTETGEVVDVVEAAPPMRSGDDPDQEAHKKRMAKLHAALHEAFAVEPGDKRSEREATAKDNLLASYKVDSASDLTPEQIDTLVKVCKKNPERVRAAAGLPEPLPVEPEPAA